MTTPPIPAAVAAAFAAFPPLIRARLLDVRAQIHAVARDIGAGPLHETLKWGQPAYLTEVSRSGTTIRLGQLRDQAAVLVHCQTTLIDEFRDRFGNEFGFDGNRALLLGDGDPPEALAICLARALTYHRKPGKLPA